MENLEIDLQEEIVTSKKTRNRKKSTSKVLKGLVTCIWTGQFYHMLRSLDEENRRFEVKFVNKLSKKWVPRDISLFTYLDSLFEKKNRPKMKYEENAKNRFKSNMVKLKKYIRELKPPRKESKSITIKTYEIIYLPPDVEKLIENLMRSKSLEEIKDGNNEVVNMEYLETHKVGAVGDNQSDFNNGISNKKIITSNGIYDPFSGKIKETRLEFNKLQKQQLESSVDVYDPVAVEIKREMMDDYRQNSNLSSQNKAMIGMKHLETYKMGVVGDNQSDFNNEMSKNEMIINNTNMVYLETHKVGVVGDNQSDFNNEMNKNEMIINNTNMNYQGTYKVGAVGDNQSDFNNGISNKKMIMSNTIINGSKSCNFGVAGGHLGNLNFGESTDIFNNITGRIEDISSTFDKDLNTFNAFDFKVDSNVPNTTIETSTIFMPENLVDLKDFSSGFLNEDRIENC